jgi:hypothetical protein
VLQNPNLVYGHELLMERRVRRVQTNSSLV